MKKSYDFTRFRELLAGEEFPQVFMFKFVGRNSKAFEESVARLQLARPGLAIKSKNPSKGGNHLAITLTLQVSGPDIVIEIYREIHAIEDLLVVL